METDVVAHFRAAFIAGLSLLALLLAFESANANDLIADWGPRESASSSLEIE
ncbi:MAG: hypothetical protein AB7O96_15295 [Pseudobdellovibrionaceae bacterium]